MNDAVMTEATILGVPIEIVAHSRALCFRGVSSTALS